MKVKIEDSWHKLLQNEFEQDYFSHLVHHLKIEKNQGKVIYPEGKNIFNAFEQTPVSMVKVVILGQDPYHGAGQAHGLSFSVPAGIKPPPSLINIYKEIVQDTGAKMDSSNGDLTPWARQGVLLLNASLTVRAGEPNSHISLGWQKFTDAVINMVSEHRNHVVFMLWGKFAQDKQGLIDETKHLVLKAAHPSPFSADKGFFGCRHFSKANHYLATHGYSPIDWKI